MVGSTVRPAHEVVVVVRVARVRAHMGAGRRRETMDDGADEETFAASHRSRVGPQD